MGGFLIWLFLVIAQGVFFGFATNAIIENKGYTENWFWWGFFFGLLALIVALTKPQRVTHSQYRGGGLYQSAESAYKQQMLAEGGWKCSCGRVQASYVSTCSCGVSRQSLLDAKRKSAQTPAPAPEKKPVTDKEKADAIREYKQLMDEGILSAEEFEAKKKQLLGI